MIWAGGREGDAEIYGACAEIGSRGCRRCERAQSLQKVESYRAVGLRWGRGGVYSLLQTTSGGIERRLPEIRLSQSTCILLYLLSLVARGVAKARELLSTTVAGWIVPAGKPPIGREGEHSVT